MRELIPLTVAAVLGALIPLMRWRGRYGHWRRTRVADLVEGARVKVGGIVEVLDEPLRVPWIGFPCVAYDVWREDPPPPDATDWHKVARDFVVREPGGDSVRVHVGSRFNVEGGVRIFHYDSGMVDGCAIVPGAGVEVVGVARCEIAVDGEGASYREPPRRWTLTASEAQPLVIVGRSAPRCH
jgi:hypothetical protein